MMTSDTAFGPVRLGDVSVTENPRISLSNDFSERMLRMEILIQSNAYFRRSLEGGPRSTRKVGCRRPL